MTILRKSDWPESPAESGIPLFSSRASLRRVIVVADADCLIASEADSWSPELVLSGLLTHDLVKLYRYADDGPPVEIPRQDYGHYRKATPGWVELCPEDEVGDDVRHVVYSDSETATVSAIIGNRAEIARAENTVKAYKELGEAAARERRAADSQAAQVAEAVYADLFITNRPSLKETRIPYGVTTCTPREALALLGLYFRAQGLYITYRCIDGRGTYTMNKGLYYWVGTRELLPAAWRWFGACAQHANGSGDQTLLHLGGSLLRRVQTALQSRDELHAAINLEQNNDTAQEVLNCLDVILVSLMGAIDVSARVAHHALSLQSGIYTAAWQKKSWLKEIEAKEGSLAATVGPNTSGRHIVTILRLLRNSVHGEALSSLSVRNLGGPVETHMNLPQADSPEILAAMDALGGRSTWGAQEIIHGRWNVDPATLTERLFPQVIELLNTLMGKTPVELLSHVSITSQDTLPPPDPQGPFAERARESIRWQLGLY
ncbi:hypothetical protein ACIQWA_21845 [Kitasatospora sp. NPDC098652]|uniref:hypothetical protein n=1 Tax=Kitasatospora sp. NPDC098652 TaxID=3364095 RepID=UPI0037F59DC7